jgi:alpha-tubulin suppressor-like RCC1 family protein
MKTLRFIRSVLLLLLLHGLVQPPPSCAQSSITAWGINATRQTNVPPALTNAVAVSAGGDHVLVLRSDGTVVAWGINTYGQTNNPPGSSNVMAIAAGYSHNLALRSDRTIVAWGLNTSGQTKVPAGPSNVIAIASGANHNLALKGNGTVIAWGSNLYGQTNVPSGLSNVVAVAANAMSSLALRADGVVVAWGHPGSTPIPTSLTYIPASLTNAVGIAAGDSLGLALLADSRVTAWPSVVPGGSRPGASLTNRPPSGLSNVVAISAGTAHGLALRGDGNVVSWGSYTSSVIPTPATNVPAGLSNVVAVSSAGDYNLALVGGGPPVSSAVLPDLSAAYGSTVYLRAQAAGGFPLGFQWRFNGQDLPGATNAVLALTNVQLSQSGAYSVVISNEWGTATNSASLLNVLPLAITSQPGGMTTFKGATAAFGVAAASPLPVSYQWRFNGTDIPGATDNTLPLPNVQFSQSGNYSAVVSNELGMASSSDARLNVIAVVDWGVLSSAITNPPADLTNVVSLAGGVSFGLALRRNGRVSAWGSDMVGDTDVPVELTNATAISANYYSCLALRADGTVCAWGNDAHGQAEVPAGLSNVVAVAAGYQHSLALTSDGRVTGWGMSTAVSNQPPDLENVTAIAAGSGISLALRGDGSIVSWGDNASVTNVPGELRDVVGVAAGGGLGLAVRADGSVLGWGDNSGALTNFLAGLSNVVAIAAGGYQILALKADGTVAAWGSSLQGLTNAPADLHEVCAIAAGYQHSMALIGDGPPFLLQPLLSRTVVYGSKVSLFAPASGAWPLTYQWLLDGTNISGATNAMLTIDHVQFGDAARYSVIVSNAFGQVTSSEARLTIAPLRITSQPQGTSTFRGDDVSLSVTVDGEEPFAYQWRFNGVELDGKTGSSLSLSNAQTFQSGAYTVSIRNAAGSITSSVADVTISDVAVWGEAYFDPYYASTTAPLGLTNIIAVAATEGRNLALKKDGTVIAWGSSSYGPVDPPADLSNVIAIAASMTHSLALLADGTVVGWGRNSTPPNDLSNVVAIAAGIDFSIGLKADGTVTAWGFDVYGSTEVPPDLSNVVAVAACSYCGLALKQDGLVSAWGWSYHGQTSVPGFGGFVAIGSGYDYCAALCANGTIAVWGDNQLVTPVPADLAGVISIGCGQYFVSALKSDGTVVLWGNQTNTPARLRNVAAISTGYLQTLALVGDAPPILKAPLSTPVLAGNTFGVLVPTHSGRVYGLEYKTSLREPHWTPLPLQAGDGSTKKLTDPTATASQRFYRVRAW